MKTIRLRLLWIYASPLLINLKSYWMDHSSLPTFSLLSTIKQVLSSLVFNEKLDPKCQVPTNPEVSSSWKFSWWNWIEKKLFRRLRFKLKYHNEWYQKYCLPSCGCLKEKELHLCDCKQDPMYQYGTVQQVVSWVSNHEWTSRVQSVNNQKKKEGKSEYFHMTPISSVQHHTS